MKKCPYCAEDIQDEAIICRYCGHDTRIPIPPTWDANSPAPSSTWSSSEVSAEGASSVQSSARTSGNAIASVILGIGAFSFLPIIGAIIAIVTGNRAKKEIRAGGGLIMGNGLATAGLLLGYLGLVPLAAVIVIVVLSLMGPSVGTATSNTGSTMAPAAVQPGAAYPTWTEIPATFAPFSSVEQPLPTSTQPYAPSCMAPSEVTAADIGRTIVVCGRVIDWGTRPCRTCEYGQYAYLTLEGGFNIISYDWLFNRQWIGSCTRVSDTVESLAGTPVFVMQSGEGYGGGKCVINSEGTELCQSGDYFQWYTCP